MVKARPSLFVLAAWILASLLAPALPAHAAPAPRDPAAGRAAARVLVEQGGVQLIGAAELAAAGLDPVAAENLQLWRDGTPAPLEQRGAGAGLELRFFAPAPGDRWNKADTYWLTVEAGSGLRMATRSAAPAGAATRSTALERGRWREPKVYDPARPGPLGDNWFVEDLRTDPEKPPATLTATLGARLPATAGPMQLVVQGTAVTGGAHALDVTVGGETRRVNWAGAGNFAHKLSFAGAGETVGFTLVPGAEPDQVLLSLVEWERQAALAFGGTGAAFDGAAGRWRYELSGVPAGAALYDVTDPALPVALTGLDGAFEDGGARSYVLAGPGTLHRPLVRAYGGLVLPEPAEAIYIAPAALQGALEPLVAHRRAGGRSVAVVDVQTIYDAWSFGRVDPEAIRSFLRHAAASWQPRPVAVTLVGDGTLDPHDYMGRGAANVNLVPPYLARVDLWLGETACEPCYGQLDGESPLADPVQDLAIGRLPVKSPEELATVVAKIIGYETARAAPGWRSRAILATDNGREADGRPDPAGDFAQMAEKAADLLPPGVRPVRVYYDPWQRDGSGAPLVRSWLIGDGGQARAKLRRTLSEGAGLVIYMGHASHWEWAFTGPPQPPGEQHLLGLYDPDSLSNGARLPIVLSMTCLTAGFHQPAFSGTTLDERMLLSASGGAVAVWGPAGLGVASGHDALLRGFMGGLRAAPGTATLGELTLAGYAALRADSASARAGDLSALRTYVLLGDPLTPARVVGTTERLVLPVVRR